MGHRIRHWPTSRRAEAFPEIAVLTLCLHSDFLIMKQEDVIEEEETLATQTLTNVWVPEISKRK